MHKSYLRFSFIFIFLFSVQLGVSQITLLGDNAPYDNVLDGDFNAVWAYWREAKQSPFWTTKIGEGKEPMGLHHGALFSMNKVGVAESRILNANSEYQHPKSGDVLNWSFGADLEYISNGTISISLVFGNHERVLAEKVRLKGSDKIIEHFKGQYVINKEDEQAGLPFVRATFYSGEDVKVYLHYVNISVEKEEKRGPKLVAEAKEKGIVLSWEDELASEKTMFNIYRRQTERTPFKKIGETSKYMFLDSNFTNGLAYTYVITRRDESESSGSNKIIIAKIDEEPPVPPTQLSTEVFETEVKISWESSKNNDIKNYSIYRGNDAGDNFQQIAHDISGNSFVDFTPEKEKNNTYIVYAHDFSGNKSVASEVTKAKVRAFKGASFSDLILPMPIHEKLNSTLWGTQDVLPRDSDNGIEHPEWSYWGGRPVKDMNGKYHMNVTRWPANATKGHWEWPNSTVAYTVADKPTGPYIVQKDVAYTFNEGYGHNPDVILCNDGTYLLYSLINWEATLFTSKTMKGPWKRLGVITVNEEESGEIPNLYYRFYRNLSGVHLDDGRYLFVTKAGAIMLSEGTNPLGPYNVLTKPIQGNSIIPEKYRNSNYEDPVIWKDDLQFHMIINAFWDYRAIYLRSKDGIHWKFNPGTAYTPNNTFYEDGTQTHWYKLERPHILQDEHLRATHLSLAVIDVPKRDDLARDKHSSKNIILPLVKHKLLKMLNKKKVDSETKKIKVLIKSEEGFNAQTDIDLESLRFGGSEEVNFGGGSKLMKTKKKGNDLILVFEGEGNSITNKNFVCKLLGRTKNGGLLIGFTHLKGM